MATEKNNDKGKEGEEQAISFLRKNGFEVLYCNWRHKHSEIDIIAKQNNTTIFVEVKARTTDNFGHPENFVTKAKQNELKKAAAAYIEQFNPDKVRFDIIAITWWPQQETDIKHFEDAFW
jgi:putative endonuclease